MAGEDVKRAGYYAPVRTESVAADRHAVDPNSPQAEALRSGRVPDMAVPPVNDPTEPLPEPSPEPERQPPAPRKDLDEPPVFADGGRRGVFERIKARDTRAVEGARPNIDPGSVPEGVGFEDETLSTPTEREPPNGRREADAATAPDKFTLKVYGNTISVTREEARRYAGLDEADEIPDAAIVRLAQKNLALDEERERVKSQRRGDAPPLADDHIGTQARTTGDSQPEPTPAQPQADELVEKLQMGAPGEALEAFRTIARSVLNEGAAQRSLAGAQQVISQEIESFGDANPDVTGDGDMAAAHRAIVARRAADELRRVAPQMVSDAAYQKLVNNPEFAGRAYATAIAEGYKVKPVGSLLEESARTVRQGFASQQQDTPRLDGVPRPAHDRAAAKERLLQQPRSDAPQQFQPPQGQRPQRRSASAVIADIKRARHQA
jgi:hypothetical protein